jgi:hypothetical protein
LFKIKFFSQAANEKLAELQADLDRRERALEQRERSYERRVKKLTRLQKEEHMKSLINSFTKEQVKKLLWWVFDAFLISFKR